MTNWELARYLIDAKKSIDSLMYISLHKQELTMINLRDAINEKRRSFYVNLCVVLDKCFPNSKKEICQDPIIDSVYYERDKNFAHKDKNYIAKEYETIDVIVDELKCQMLKAKEICFTYLPANLTLDFLPFDSNYFRLANGVTREKEEQLKQIKHPLKDKGKIVEGTVKEYNVFYDTEDLKKIPDKERSNYAVIMSAGLCIEEMLQNMQDASIRINVIYGQNMWVSVNQEKINQIVRMRKLKLLDVFDIPYEPKTKKELKSVIELMRKEGLLNDEI